NRTPHCLPARDEEGGPDRDGFWRGRNSVAQLGPVERRGNLPLGVVPRRKGSAPHSANCNRLRFCRSQYGLRKDWREMLDLPETGSRNAAGGFICAARTSAC